MKIETITPRLKSKQTVLWLLGGIIFIAGIYGYLKYREYFPSTDDAYVQAHVIDVAAQVSGPIIKIAVENNQKVQKDELLFKIDPRPFADALEQAQAQYALAQQQMQADIEAVHVAEANLEQAQAELLLNKKTNARTQELVKKGQASIQDGDNAKAQYDSSVAKVAGAKNQLAQAKAQLGEVGERNAQIRQAKANLDDAKLNLSYTDVKAPADGYVTNFEVRKGSMVSAQQPLFQFVESKVWWVYANFKETQLEHIAPGQKASIKVDLYPGHDFRGYVQSISRGSGAAFSLLPPENATGNWVKVTQRFPVKIIVSNTSDAYPLRVGASSTVTVDTVSKHD